MSCSSGEAFAYDYNGSLTLTHGPVVILCNKNVGMRQSFESRGYRQCAQIGQQPSRGNTRLVEYRLKSPYIST